MSSKHKSPSRLRRDQYRLSVYNCCQQILEIERKNETILMLEDQTSMLNETIFKNFDKMDKLENELAYLKKTIEARRSRLSFRKVFSLDIPPSPIPGHQSRKWCSGFPDPHTKMIRMAPEE